MSNCEGCTTHKVGEHFNCSFIADNEDGSCPCTKCIVKVICDEPCDDFEEWVDKRSML